MPRITLSGSREGKMSQERTVEHLKALRSELVERRHNAAYSVASPQHKEGLEALVLVHHAILALDAVIAEGRPGV